MFPIAKLVMEIIAAITSNKTKMDVARPNKARVLSPLKSGPLKAEQVKIIEVSESNGASTNHPAATTTGRNPSHKEVSPRRKIGAHRIVSPRAPSANEKLAVPNGLLLELGPAIFLIDFGGSDITLIESVPHCSGIPRPSRSAQWSPGNHYAKWVPPRTNPGGVPLGGAISFLRASPVVSSLGGDGFGEDVCLQNLFDLGVHGRQFEQ